MNSRPWLAVAVYARAPAADAPIATLIAANSLSTLMKSHGASVPSFTSSPSPSTMCVCGEIGYAQMTSGRQSATASATACEPSVCLSMGQSFQFATHDVVGLGRGGDIVLGHGAGKLGADRVRDGVERDEARQGGEAAEQHRVGQRPAEVLARDLGGGHGEKPFTAKALRDLGEAELVEAALAVDEDVAVGLEALEDVDLVQQGRVLDDQHVGRQDRLAQADLVIVDAAESHHRRAGALGAEARKRLRMAALLEGR